MHRCCNAAKTSCSRPPHAASSRKSCYGPVISLHWSAYCSCWLWSCPRHSGFQSHYFQAAHPCNPPVPCVLGMRPSLLAQLKCLSSPLQKSDPFGGAPQIDPIKAAQKRQQLQQEKVYTLDKSRSMVRTYHLQFFAGTTGGESSR